MGAVFEAQFQNLRDAFSRADRDIRVARDRAGHPLYVYEADRLLVGTDDREAFSRVTATLRDFAPEPIDREIAPGLVLRDITGPQLAGLGVPEILALIDASFGDRHPARLTAEGLPPAAPDHVLGIAKICPAGEPTVPTGDQNGPWPAQVDPGVTGRFRVTVAVSDTGLVQPLDLGRNPWLGLVGSAAVNGDPDLVGPLLPNGLNRVDEFTGHGLFIAGVVRCSAPSADVFVNDHFTSSGGEVESVMISKLNDLLTSCQPQVINLSAGTYTRENWQPLGMTAFGRQLHQQDIVLVAAAGNDSTCRPFFPAALPRGNFPNIVSVGALGADLVNPAWFTNYGHWVDVFALGDMVNAYPVGEYTYQEPPRRPSKQQFTAGLARWEGTSYAAPMVAGMIADRIARTGDSPTAALAAVLAQAQAMVGEGRKLLPDVRP